MSVIAVLMASRRSASPSPHLSSRPDFVIETRLIETGTRFVVGVDEAGRGPLAGPVVASAVILDPAAIPNGLNDSKKLSAKAREEVFEAILATSTVAFASAGPAEIDRVNIRAASLAAMRRAVRALPLDLASCHCLVDGIDVPPDLAWPATALVSGDARSLSVAAASIVAKVMRDRMMTRLDAVLPMYGFRRHMGYGTKAHVDALAAAGPSPHHRYSFAPVRHAKAAG